MNVSRLPLIIGFSAAVILGGASSLVLALTSSSNLAPLAGPLVVAPVVFVLATGAGLILQSRRDSFAGVSVLWVIWLATVLSTWAMMRIAARFGLFGAVLQGMLLLFLTVLLAQRIALRRGGALLLIMAAALVVTLYPPTQGNALTRSLLTDRSVDTRAHVPTAVVNRPALGAELAVIAAMSCAAMLAVRPRRRQISGPSDLPAQPASQG